MQAFQAGEDIIAKTSLLMPPEIAVCTPTIAKVAVHVDTHGVEFAIRGDTRCGHILQFWAALADFAP